METGQVAEPTLTNDEFDVVIQLHTGLLGDWEDERETNIDEYSFDLLEAAPLAHEWQSRHKLKR